MGKKDGSKKSVKIKLLIAIAVIVTLGAGIVLAITYWPAKISDVTNSMDSVISYFVDDNDLSVITEYFNDALPQMQEEAQNDTSENDPKDGYYFEMKSFGNIVYSAETALIFYDGTIERSIEGKFDRRTVRDIQSSLNGMKYQMQKMASSISGQEDAEVNFTIILSVYEGLRENYIKFVEYLSEAYTKLYDLYNQSSLSGIYGNDANVLSLKAMTSYITFTYKNLFTEENITKNVKPSAEKGYYISQYMKSFSHIYGYVSHKNITDYYKNEILRKNIKTLKDFEESSENKINFDYLIQNDFDHDFGFSEAKERKCEGLVKFLNNQDLGLELIEIENVTSEGV